MTTKPEHPVVEALERIVQNHSMYCEHHVGVSSHAYELARIAETALPLARELVEYKEGLEWQIRLMKTWRKSFVERHVLSKKDCPTIIKRLISK